MALFFGANDMGSLMIEENVVAQAGTVYYLSLETIRRSIEEAGYIPRQRNVFYQYVDSYDSSANPSARPSAGRQSAPVPSGLVSLN
jgi:cyclic dehypoxanthinyl futalosine synthase